MDHYDSQKAYEETKTKVDKGGFAVPDLGAPFLPCPRIVERRKWQIRWMKEKEVPEWLISSTMRLDKPPFDVIKELHDTGMTIKEISSAYYFIYAKRRCNGH